MIWSKKVEILKDNKYNYIGDRYINLLNGKEYWISDLKLMNKKEFQNLISHNNRLS